MPDRTRNRLESQERAQGRSDVTLLKVHIVNGVEWQLSRYGNEILIAEPLYLSKPLIVYEKTAVEAAGLPFNPIAFVAHLDKLNVANWTLHYCDSVMEYPGAPAMVGSA